MASTGRATTRLMAVLAVCFTLALLLSTALAAMAADCPNDCKTACNSYTYAACRITTTDGYCDALNQCRARIFKPCNITCNNICSAGIKC